MLGDLLLVNGRILTMNPGQPEAEAVAIRSGRIAMVGDDPSVRLAAAPGSEIIDLRGRTAAPGLNDAHAHPISVGQALGDLNLASPPNRDIGDLLELVAEAARGQAPGTWIIGRGYDQARLADQRHPTRQDLDAVAPDHPVILIRACHHIAAVNSRALALAGITSGTPDPDGGTIDRDAHGEPTGVVRESAQEMVRSVMGEPSIEDLKSALRRGGEAFLASGVTSTVEAGISNADQFQAYQQLRASDELPVRTYLMMMLDETMDALTSLGITTGFGDDWLRIGPVKLFSDGSIGGRTARMHQPFTGETDNVGLWMMDPDVLKEKVRRAHAAGFQVGIHAIGDAAIDLVLDAYEAAMDAHPRPDPRHRIEHCSIIDERILGRIAHLGVIPVPGTSFLYHFRDAYVQNLGLNRLRYTYGMASFLKHGITAAASTDAPVVPTSATIGLQTMMTRRDAAGEEVWPEERVTLSDAIRAYTVNAAYASFEERHKGTLAAGMLGDVTVFETDLSSVDPESLGDVKVDLTISDGRVVFARG
ncbi:MAG TPA: amidohydrolase [Thermomicrobiales bacterium]|nr:amidohydrolase [Thermomicrobiales bacterium]